MFRTLSNDARASGGDGFSKTWANSQPAKEA